MIAGLHEAYQRSQVHYQIGDNNNLFDWTYVSNVADSHLLAADKLYIKSAEEIAQIKADLHHVLPSIECTTHRDRVPTSESRPLGPYIELPPDAEKITANWQNPDYQGTPRPNVRNRFDLLAESSLIREDEAQLQVAGQAFYITNGESMYFWDLPRVVWTLFDEHYGTTKMKRSTIEMSRQFGLILGTAAETWAWLVGKKPGFTRFRVMYTCVDRSYNIEKARRVLGYHPRVGMQEGLQRAFEVILPPRRLFQFFHSLFSIRFSGG